ncbi:hypothetical protein AAG570_008629 [Ranatra chinensis]|uniref:Uncharacterized protein n=1 Tax=Ranatra chinensis TaxID=642074 RepID=A0ABD0YRJ6_9HEMI
MYSRSERFPVDAANKVGPGSYAIDDRTLIKEAWPPFHSGTTRAENLKKTDLSPTSYYPKYRTHKIQGGKSLQYTAPRTYQVPPLGPSPSAYDPTHITPLPQKKPYFEKANRCKLRVKGWGANTAVRITTKIENESNPGPGEYELRERPPTEYEMYMENFRDLKRRTTHCKRYPDDIVALELQKRKTFKIIHTPAPCDYGIPEVRVRHTVVRNAPFMCRMDRFKNEKVDCSPGPPSYNPQQGTINYEMNRKLPSIYAKRTVFGDYKIHEPQEKTILPGPGHYDVKDKPSKRKVFHFEDMKALSSERFPKKKLHDDFVSPFSYSTADCSKKLLSPTSHRRGKEGVAFLQSSARSRPSQSDRYPGIPGVY